MPSERGQRRWVGTTAVQFNSKMERFSNDLEMETREQNRNEYFLEGGLSCMGSLTLLQTVLMAMPFLLSLTHVPETFCH